MRTVIYFQFSHFEKKKNWLTQSVVSYASVLKEGDKIVFWLHALIFTFRVYSALLCQVCRFIHKLQVEAEVAIFPLWLHFWDPQNLAT